jgi:NitT/TauT family transport system substrate-binding protein
VRVIAGSTSGGAQLVVSPDITSPEQLKGKIIATPQKGNTQDVALKKWLKENNLDGQITVQNLDNPRTLDLFPHQPDRGRLAARAVDVPD